MNKFLSIAGLAALSAATDLTLQQLLDQANTVNNGADEADNNVMQAVVDQINALQAEIASLG